MASENSCRELLARMGDLNLVIKTMRRELPPGPRAGISLMMAMRRHGEVCIGDLSALLDVGPSVVSRHVADLEERGWLERVPNPRDRRSWYVRATPRGERALEGLLTRAGRALARTLDDWTDEEIAELSGLLARLRTSFAAQRANTAEPCRTPSAAKGV